MNKERIFGLLRHVLTFGGGYLAAKGFIDEASIEPLVGAVVTIGGVVWSVFTPEKKTAS